MRLTAGWMEWWGKNRLSDSDNDRTPLPFFHSLRVKGIRVWRTK
jgi:hypothetical protein